MTKLNSLAECSYSFNFDRTPNLQGANDKILSEYGAIGVRLMIPDYHSSDSVPYASYGMSSPVAVASPCADPVISGTVPGTSYAPASAIGLPGGSGITNSVRMPQTALYHPDITESGNGVCSESHDYCLSKSIEFELFKNMLFKTLPEYLPPQTSIGIQQYSKENGKVLHGLTFTPPQHQGERPDILTSPVIYIDSLFKEYLNFELGMKEICMIIAREYNENLELPFKFNAYQFMDYAQARKRLVLKLLNREKNAELLKSTPHMDHSDLSLIASYVLPDSTGNEYTCTVNNKMLEIWNINREKLFADARASSESMLPLKIRSMTDFMNDINLNLPKSNNIISEAPELFILTNSICNCGASSIFYKGAAEKCLEIIGGDFYILPSSVHELLLISKSKSPDPDSLRNTVAHVNSVCVKDTEYLSGNVYSFNFKKHTIKIV